jgi:hypothetical protein
VNGYDDVAGADEWARRRAGEVAAAVASRA